MDPVDDGMTVDWQSAAVLVAPVVTAAAFEAEVTADPAAADVADCAAANKADRAGDETAGYSADSSTRCPAGGICRRTHGDDGCRSDRGCSKLLH